MSRKEEEIKEDFRGAYSPFAKRTHEQRNADRAFIKSILEDDIDISKMEIHRLLHEEIKRRGDFYDVTYTYVTLEVKRIRKELLEDSAIDPISEGHKSLEIIDEQIKLCLNEISERFKDRIVEIVEDEVQVKIDELGKLTIEQQSLFYQIQEKLERTSIKRKKVIAGTDVSDMMKTLVLLLQRKAAITGEDAPKKAQLNVDMTAEIKQMNYEVMAIEFKKMGLGEEEAQQMQNNILQLLTKKDEPKKIEQGRSPKKGKGNN